MLITDDVSFKLDGRLTSRAFKTGDWSANISIRAHLTYTVFTGLHVMQTRYSEENSVCLSVCLSVTRVDCDKTVE